MSQEIDWGQRAATAALSGQHRDYQYNLGYARDFCNRVRDRLPEGMRVEISSSQWLTDNLLMISWNPGRYAKKGIYAHPVSLNQSREEVQRETNAIYKDFILKAVKFIENQKINS